VARIFIQKSDAIYMKKIWNYVSKTEVGLLTILPTLIILPLLIIPTIYIIWFSFWDDGVTANGYLVVFNDPRFWSATVFSLIYTGLTVSCQVFLGLSVAIVLHKQQRFLPLITILLFLPYAVPSVVAVMSWEFLLNDNGQLAVFFQFFGVKPTNWMSNWAFVTLIVISIWQFYPFVLVAILANLRRIPSSMYLNAVVDGANSWQQFLYITLPQIKNTLTVIILFRTAFMFTKYDTPWLLVGSNAVNINLLPIYIDEKLRNINNLSAQPVMAAAVLIGVWVVILTLPFLYFVAKSFKKN
jgi:multiple sugar transport system permease protein